MDQSTLRFTNPAIGQFFVDYILHDSHFFRVGKHSATWGQGRLVGNPGNLISNMGDGIAIRANTGLGPVNATGVMYTTSASASGGSGPRSFAYAGLLERSGGKRTVGVSSYYRYAQRLRTAAYYKTAFGGVDVAAEGVTAWDVHGYRAEAELENLDPNFTGLVNAFWESSGTPRLSVLGEYIFDSAIPDYAGHKVGIALRLSELSWTRWPPSIRWLHSFNDNSGQVVVGSSRTIAPGLSASFGVPVFYRGPTFLDPDDDEEIPDDYVVSVLFTISMSLSF